MSDAEDRTAEPSAHRIKLAREMGHVPLAPALVRALVLAMSLGLCFARLPALGQGLVVVIQSSWKALPNIAHKSITVIELQWIILNNLAKLAEPLLVVCLGTVVSGLLVHQATTGGSWTPALALPDISRLWAFWAKFDEETGSSHPPLAHRLLLGILRPLAAFSGCAVVLMVMRIRWQDNTLANGTWNRQTLMAHMARGQSSLGMGLIILTIPLVCLGIVEMALARVRWRDRLRPSQDQARQEVRELEGNPDLKKRRQKLARTVRDSGTIERLIADTAVVIVGSSMNGLCVQLVRLKTGRLAVGQAVRGAISAKFAEKAAALGHPWLRDANLARRLAALADPKGVQTVELPTGLAADIQRRISGKAASATVLNRIHHDNPG